MAVTPRRPESVLVVVYATDGQVLVLRRIQPFDFWQSVTGSLNPGETHAEAAARELEEETGFTTAGQLRFSGTTRTFTIDPRWRDRYAPGITENLEYEWHYVLDRPLPVRLADDEHSEYQWLPRADALATVWSWTNKDAIEALPIPRA